MKQIDKNALHDWEKYKEDIYRSTPVDQSMSHADREKHRIYLESHPIEWIQFFFPGYAKYDFADFQKRAIKRIMRGDFHARFCERVRVKLPRSTRPLTPVLLP